MPVLGWRVWERPPGPPSGPSDLAAPRLPRGGLLSAAGINGTVGLIQPAECGG